MSHQFSAISWREQFRFRWVDVF